MCNKTEKRLRNKLKALELRGSKCEDCGFDKNIAALSFHHLDPNQKEREIHFYLSKTWERFKAELDKCALLCLNCHAIRHAQERLLENVNYSIFF